MFRKPLPKKKIFEIKPEPPISEEGLKIPIKEVQLRWKHFVESEANKWIKTGLRYYLGENDIKENGRYEMSLDLQNKNKPHETRLSDRRIAHNFLKFIITQQVSYGIARKFSLTKSTIEELETEDFFRFIKSKLFSIFSKTKKNKFDMFNILVSKTFSKSNYSQFLDACGDAPKCGLGWIYVFYNDNAQLNFLRMNPEELCPVWADEKHTKLSCMIRRYKTVVFEDDGEVEKEYYEIYEQDRIYKYLINPDDSGDEPKFVSSSPYFKYENGEIGNFPFIPFIPIRYNGTGASLLSDIKDMVDGYDKLQSETINNVVDIPDSLTAVTGFDGTNQNEKDDFVNNVKIHRFLFLPEGADAKAIVVPQDIAQNELTLTRLRKDIFEIGGGVDTQNKDLKDTSGVALRWSYSNLEEKFNSWAKQIDVAIGLLIELIIFDNKSLGGEDFSDIDYEVIYDTDSIINESETINNLVLSKGLISPETIAEQHPYTKNGRKEYEGMIKQMEFERELDVAQNDGNNDHNAQEGISGKSF